MICSSISFTFIDTNLELPEGVLRCLRDGLRLFKLIGEGDSIACPCASVGTGTNSGTVGGGLTLPEILGDDNGDLGDGLVRALALSRMQRHTVSSFYCMNATNRTFQSICTNK